MKSVLTALVAAIALSSAMPRVAAQGKTVIIQKVIVKVNGEIFTLTDLTQRQIQLLRDQNRQIKTAEELQTDAGLRQALAEVTPKLLNEAVDELLLVQRGRELGAKFGDDEFKRALDNIKKENNLDDAGLVKALQQEGITLQELRQNFERTSLMQAVQRQEIMPTMTITDEEKRQYYAAHPEEFIKPATVTLRELFIAVPSTQKGVSVGLDEEAKAKVQAARDRAMKGEDFAKIVGEISEAGSKANGGLISDVLIANAPPALAEMLSKMKPGEITEPIRSQQGYTLFKLESRIEAVPEPFDKVRDQITQKIYDTRMDGETKKFLDKLRTQALIEWKDEGYRQMYEKARATKAQGPAPKAQGPTSGARPRAQGPSQEPAVRVAY